MRVSWNDAGSRFYHVGIDRGMLYVGFTAVPWNGLVSVTESPVTGDVASYYVDGQKSLNVAASEDFACTIETLGAPVEFFPCAGRLELSPALYVLDQPKQPFSFSYRTIVGNDQAGPGYAYKIHIVYNASAQVSDFAHETVSDGNSLKSQSFIVTTAPVAIAGFRPTAHLIFDTRKVSSDNISALEDILYGNDSDDPRLPAADEIVALLAS